MSLKRLHWLYNTLRFNRRKTVCGNVNFRVYLIKGHRGDDALPLQRRLYLTPAAGQDDDNDGRTS